MEKLKLPAAWDTSVNEPYKPRWFTPDENKFWLKGLNKTQAERFLKTVAMLDVLGISVLAYRNERKTVCFGVFRVYDGKIVNLMYFDSSANRWGTSSSLIFARRLDKPARNSNAGYSGDLLPIAKLTGMLYKVLSKEAKGGTVLSFDEAKKLGPLLFLYPLEQARSLYNDGLDFVDIYPLFQMGVSFDELKASLDIPKTYLEYLYASDTKVQPIVDPVNFPELTY